MDANPRGLRFMYAEQREGRSLNQLQRLSVWLSNDTARPRFKEM